MNDHEGDQNKVDNINIDFGGHELPTIQIVRGELHRIVRESIAALKRSNAPIYDRGGALVRPVRLEVAEVGAVRHAAGSIVLRPVDAAWIRLQLARSATFVRWVASEKKAKPIDPPIDIAALIAGVPDEGNWPHLHSVVRHPVLMLDGRWIGRGYHDGLLIDTDDSWIEPAKTREAALGALVFLREHLQHYRWESTADESVAISLLVSTLMRPVLDAVPMHAVDAPTAGSGKSLLVDCAAILSTGVRAPVMDYGRDPVEAAKRLDAMLLAGDSILCLDNIEAPLEGSGLCQTLTQGTRRVRPLGASVMVNVPCTAMVTATGNNLVLRGDIIRRAVVCRIDPRVERPELRRIHQDLIVETTEDRVALVMMCQTIVRAYLAATPMMHVAPLGSFEQWSRTVRAALMWLDMPDPVTVMERTRQGDPTRESLLAVLSAWHAAFDNKPAAVADAIARAEHDVSMHDALTLVAMRRGNLDGLALGYWLRGHRDNRAGSFVLRRHGGRAGVVRWSSVDGGDGGDGGDVSATRARNLEGEFEVGVIGTCQPMPTIPTNGTVSAPTTGDKVCPKCDGEGDECRWCRT